jgi:molybdopterin-guanine dinucleotide biosynthesis protein A
VERSLARRASPRACGRGHQKIDRWTARYKLATVTWPVEPLDPFFNANTMDDIAEADRLAALDGGDSTPSHRSPRDRG